MSHLYRFGHFSLDLKKRTLVCRESLVPVTAKAFDLLAYLVENPNRVLTKKELLETVWTGSFVEEGVLTQYIFQLRKVFTNDSVDNRWIVTIAGRGYQFTADVAIDEVEEDSGLMETEAARPVEVPLEANGPRSKYSLRTAVALLAVALVLTGVGYFGGRYFRPTPPPEGSHPESEKVMLAVLPFENLTGDPKEEYLSDGLTEELISQLGRLHPEQLGVIARTSVMGYKQGNKRLDQISRELSVQYVIEGSVRHSADRFRVTVQLIHVKDQSHLWSQDYDYRPQDILALEDGVAMAVARVIQLSLTPEQQVPLSSLRPVNAEAFNAYLQGRYFIDHPFPQANLDKATRDLEQAVKLDPDYALAWTSLAHAWRFQVIWGYVPNGEGFQRAKEAAERALALDPNLAEAYSEMGWIKLNRDWNWVEADTFFRRALALDPGNSSVLSDAANMEAFLRRFDEALNLSHRAVQLDPRDALSRRFLGQIFYWAGRQDEAEEQLNRALELDPNSPEAHWKLGFAYLSQGHAQEALAEENQEPLIPARLQGEAIVYHAMGRKAESDAALTELVAKYPEGRYVFAEAYAFRGETDQALHWLEEAYDHNDGDLREIKIDPLLKSVHGESRYIALLKKLHVPQ